VIEPVTRTVSLPIGTLAAAMMCGGVLIFGGLLLGGPEPTIWVGVWGSVPERVVLEVGSRAWGAEGAVTTIPARDPVILQAVGRETCTVYASFVAHPGSKWGIRFGGTGEPSLENLTGRGMELGPGVGEVAPSGCDFAERGRP
jgi:hypothetical protein